MSNQYIAETVKVSEFLESCLMMCKQDANVMYMLGAVTFIKRRERERECELICQVEALNLVLGLSRENPSVYAPVIAAAILMLQMPELAATVDLSTVLCAVPNNVHADNFLHYMVQCSLGLSGSKVLRSVYMATYSTVAIPVGIATATARVLSTLATSLRGANKAKL